MVYDFGGFRDPKPQTLKPLIEDPSHKTPIVRFDLDQAPSQTLNPHFSCHYGKKDWVGRLSQGFGMNVAVATQDYVSRPEIPSPKQAQ